MKTDTNIVFVDIDTQKDFMEPEGALYVSGAEKLTDNLKQLTTFALKNDIPIIASADAHVPDDPEFEQFPPHCVQNTPGQKKISETLKADFKVIPNKKQSLQESDFQNNLLLEKQTFDVFDNPNADTVFDRYADATFVVYGVTTDYCVKAAVEGLRKRNRNVILIEDAIKPVDPDAGKKALDNMKKAGVELKSTDAILKELETGTYESCVSPD